MVKKTRCPSCLYGWAVNLEAMYLTRRINNRGSGHFDAMASSEAHIVLTEGESNTTPVEDFYCHYCDTEWQSLEEFMDEYEPQVLILAETFHG